ncbi:MAG: FAD binding domain-containing protein [Desulfatiglandales bacterium]
MLIPHFNYHVPDTLREACRMKAELRENACIIAGGTDVVVNLKKGLISQKNLISLKMLDQLRLMRADSSRGCTVIGACTSASGLLGGHIAAQFSALAACAESLGSPLIRNRATIGGNLVTARPAADLPPSLMAYGARVVLSSMEGEREVSLDEFFVGPGKTILRDDEILTQVILDKLPPYSGGGYLKLGLRKALEIGLVNVAAYLALERPHGPISEARIVLGAVAPTPRRAVRAEKHLIGKRPAELLFVETGHLAAEESEPIDDFRGSAAYRKEMVKVLTERALQKALHEATNKH